MVLHLRTSRRAETAVGHQLHIDILGYYHPSTVTDNLVSGITKITEVHNVLPDPFNWACRSHGCGRVIGKPPRERRRKRTDEADDPRAEAVLRRLNQRIYPRSFSRYRFRSDFSQLSSLLDQNEMCQAMSCKLNNVYPERGS